MEVEANFKGIKPKIVKEKDGTSEEIYLVTFEICTSDFDDAVKIKSKLESHLENWLNGQKEL